MSLPEKPLLSSQGPRLHVQYYCMVLNNVRAGVGHRTAPQPGRVKRSRRTQDTPAHTVNHLSTYMKKIRGQASDRYMYTRLEEPKRRGGTVVPPTRPGILKSTSSKTCMSRINTCKSTCKVRSTCTAAQQESAYACTHPAVQSVGSHRRTASHMSLLHVKGTMIQGHGDGVRMYGGRAQGVCLPCFARRASCMHTPSSRCRCRCGLMHAPVNASAAGAALS